MRSREIVWFHRQLFLCRRRSQVVREPTSQSGEVFAVDANANANANEDADEDDNNNNNNEEDTIRFQSRRSPVICRNGCVATSQPLASEIGLSMLKRGANAAEAAIAISAALCVTEPCSCGLGGDMFSLYYDATAASTATPTGKGKKAKTATAAITAINGSGKSPAHLTLERVRKDCHNSTDEFRFSAHAVTVPGAAKGWEDLLERHGSGNPNFTLAQLVEPAARLAEEGFPVAPITAYHWKNGMSQITKWLDDDLDGNNEDAAAKIKIPLTVDGTNAPPNAGDIIKNPDLANVLRELGAKGAMEGFYKGFPGQAIVDTVQKHGGVLTLDDLADVESTFPDPIGVTYRNVKLWQIPPNGQGIAGLIALKGLECLEEENENENENENKDNDDKDNDDNDNDVDAVRPGSADWYHRMIEMMRLGFADARAHVADPDHMTISSNELLDETRIQSRAKKLFSKTNATIAGIPDPSSCTVSFQVVDRDGNAISFVNSNFMGFGTGIVPDKCGFALQNRGFGFHDIESINDDHPNVLAPSKRPYHTIIPGMLTYKNTKDNNDDDDNNNNTELYATLSNMGGNMQPQGHMQLTVNMVAGNMDPQAAIDFPRFCIADGTQQGQVLMEKETPVRVTNELKRRGHNLQSGIDGHGKAIFGRAQIITRNPKTGVLWAADAVIW